MRSIAIIVAATSLAGCASSTMNGFVGKPLESVMVRYGPPANVFDMPDGRRAFQWRINSSFVLPGHSSTYTTAQLYAPPGQFAQVTGASNTTYTPAQQINQSCLYTMYARQQDGHWTFVGYEKPRLMCE